ncbi:LPS translocon maturation chaperone LptM [Uliginosibacterium sp. H1]|uniref:LPS translocon maturation chaperone LptM n=1 Tax=Uliginosibacterium sp. H1 TaxID=3114757 RepID=UPI002E170F21|nr:lipoprotein [Uliginosibacterium sp. H1]
MRILLTCALLLSITACGIKGGLYLPPPQQAPAPAPTSAADHNNKPTTAPAPIAP